MSKLLKYNIQTVLEKTRLPHFNWTHVTDVDTVGVNIVSNWGEMAVGCEVWDKLTPPLTSDYLHVHPPCARTNSGFSLGLGEHI